MTSLTPCFRLTAQLILTRMPTEGRGYAGAVGIAGTDAHDPICRAQEITTSADRTAYFSCVRVEFAKHRVPHLA